MANSSTEQALELAQAEAQTRADQLREARADRHRLGIADQNRALVCAAVWRALRNRNFRPLREPDQRAITSVLDDS